MNYNKLIKDFKYLFKELGPPDFDLESDLINMYLVSLGLRSACLISISNLNIFYTIPSEANLEIHFERYPEFNKTNGRDYPMVTLKNSWVSRYLSKLDRTLTDLEIGLCIGYFCYDQYDNSKSISSDRYAITFYLKGPNFTKQIYAEMCSNEPVDSQLLRIQFKAKMYNDALKLINKKYTVKYEIEFLERRDKKFKIFRSR